MIKKKIKIIIIKKKEEPDTVAAATVRAADNGPDLCVSDWPEPWLIRGRRKSHRHRYPPSVDPLTPLARGLF